MLYFYLKAGHLVADFIWIGGMLINAFVIGMVPAPIRSGVITALRGYNIKVTTVAMAFAWLFGLGLAFGYGFYSSGWFGFKFLLVVLLSALHGMQSGWLRRMSANPLLDPPAFVRAGMMITLVSIPVIVLLAVVKPF